MDRGPRIADRAPWARFSDSTQALLSMCIFKFEQSFVFVTLQKIEGMFVETISDIARSICQNINLDLRRDWNNAGFGMLWVAGQK